jgi:hypothetical protein
MRLEQLPYKERTCAQRFAHLVIACLDRDQQPGLATPSANKQTACSDA